ncbi:hypothetical protein C7M84_008868 [Penaeus vannamei]|uniref:Uncharacterized protein n=1 Tax=Penaeus vannamei TaxID=6689 RepID=A0A423T8F6_PENVA|nr:hypothetical protein C7M84_008868 [Penaeus vannamei]
MWEMQLHSESVIGCAKGTTFTQSAVGSRPGKAAASFLRVADDLDTTAAGGRENGLTVTDCGFRCFNAGRSACRGFVWRPIVDASYYDLYNSSRNATSDDDAATTHTLSPLVGSSGTGRCGLLKCVPPPSSLTAAPGSQIYLMTGTNAWLMARLWGEGHEEGRGRRLV